MNSVDSSENFESINARIISEQKVESRENPKFGEKIWQLCQECQNNEVTYIKFAPNTKLIAGGTNSGIMFIWDVTTGKQLFAIKASQNAIHNLLWTPDSLTIISIYSDAKLNFWDATNGNLKYQVDLGNKIGDIKNLDISHNGHLLAITSLEIPTNYKFSLWAVDESFQEINFIKFLINQSSVIALDVQFSPKDDQIALYLRTPRIIIWKKESNEFILRINQTVGILNKPTDGGIENYKENAIAFSLDGKTLYVTLLSSRNIYLLDTATGDPKTPLNPKRTGLAILYVNSVSAAVTNSLIAYSPISDNYGFETSFGFEIFDYSTNKIILEKRTASTTVEMSDDGSMLATIGIDQTVTIWNTIPNSEIKALTGHRGIVWETDFLNETILVTSSTDSVRIWKNDFLLKTLEGDRLNNTHPDGVAITETLNKDILVAFGTKEGKIVLYNYTDDSIVELLGHKGEVAELDFSPDGSFLASAGESSLKIWNTSTQNLITNFQNYPGDDVVLNKGVEFLSNTKVVVSGGPYGNIYIFDINGTKILNEFMPDFVISFDVSEDRKILSVFTDGGYIVLLNLTSGKILREQKLSIFENTLQNTIFFADVDFTPDNKYIIACSGFRHTLYFIDTQDLIINHSIFLNIQDSFRTKIEPNSWTLSVSKDDYSVSLYDMSPLKTDNFKEFDFDGDGMSDFWEQDNSLSSNWYWDRFDDPDNDELVNWEEYYRLTNPQSIDSDGDGISDTYEIKYGLKPTEDDSLLDKDGDGMNNLFEFKMGLDSSIDDSALDPDLDGLSNLQEFNYQTDIHKSDSDNDGIPDKWEVEHGLNPVDPQDAASDNDFDGISNIEEYRQGSDPNNFFLVPLISLNYFYMMIGLVSVILVLISYMQYRRYITDSYSSPDYSSALKAKQAGLDSWYDYTIQANSINTRLEKAKSLLLEGLVNQSVLQYQSIIDDLQLLGIDVERANVLSRLVFIESKLLKTVNIEYYTEKFPKKGSGALLSEYRKIIDGYNLESTNNPGLALANWNQVLKSETKLSPEHNFMIKHAMIDTMISSYQVEASNSLSTKINQEISLLIKEARNKGYLDIVCGAYLLSARILFYDYRLKDAMDVLDQVTNIAKKNKFTFFIKLISSEVENFEKIRNSIKDGLALKDKTIAEDDEALREYMIQARNLLVEFKEN